MANETIASLPSVATPNATDLVPIEHGASGGPYATSQTSIGAILALASSGGSGSGSSLSYPEIVQSQLSIQYNPANPYVVTFPNATTAGNTLLIITRQNSSEMTASGWEQVAAIGNLAAFTKTAAGGSADTCSLVTGGSGAHSVIWALELANVASGTYGGAGLNTTTGYNSVLPDFAEEAGSLVFFAADATNTQTPFPDFPYQTNAEPFGIHIQFGYRRTDRSGLTHYCPGNYNDGGAANAIVFGVK